MSADVAKAAAAFLESHPDFLAENPSLYRTLTPPRRVHGEGLADHMAAMVVSARAHAQLMDEQASLVLEAGRAAQYSMALVQGAVLALIRNADPVDCVNGELAALLAADCASLCLEGFRAGLRTLPAGTVERVMGGRGVVERERPSEAALLHGEAAGLAGRDALVRIAGRAPMLLALGWRGGGPTLGQAPLRFLGEVLGALLGRTAA